MQKKDQMRRIRRVGTLVFVVVFALVVGPVKSGWTAESTTEETAETTTEDYLENARIGAEAAKAEAENAMIEAEKAMAEAEEVIRKAKASKEKAKKQKVHALEKMVRAGYYPDDITLTDVNGKISAVFSHQKHTSREKLKCTECHPRIFIMKVDDKVIKQGNLTMEEMKKGKYCGNCHNGKKAFSVSDIKSCRRCHPKQK